MREIQSAQVLAFAVSQEPANYLVWSPMARLIRAKHHPVGLPEGHSQAAHFSVVGSLAIRDHTENKSYCLVSLSLFQCLSHVSSVSALVCLAIASAAATPERLLQK